MIPKFSGKGWEIADDMGVFESEETSVVYPTKKACQAAIDAQRVTGGFDELAAMERRFDN